MNDEMSPRFVSEAKIQEGMSPRFVSEAKIQQRTVLYVQAVRGPILLITVGALFAIQQAGLLPVSRTWPLFIIVFGVMKLVERLALPRPYLPPGGPVK